MKLPYKRLLQLRDLLEQATPDEVEAIRLRLQKAEYDRTRYHSDILFREYRKASQRLWRQQNPELVKAQNAKRAERKTIHAQS